MSNTVDYGAVEQVDANLDKPFDAAHTYYLPGDKKLSREERLRRILTIGLPIIIALLIMGGAALYLLKDFNRLYPGPGGSPSTASRSAPLGPTNKSKPSIPATTTKTSKNASCSAHKKCAALVGDCCPTSRGIFLDCC